MVRERQQLVDSLARILKQLGLERRAKPVPALAEYIAEKYSEPEGEPEPVEPESESGEELEPINEVSPCGEPSKTTEPGFDSFAGWVEAEGAVCLDERAAS